MKKGGMIVLCVGVLVMFGIVGVAMWEQEKKETVQAADSVLPPAVIEQAEARQEVKVAAVIPAEEPAVKVASPEPAPPTVLNFKTEKILPVGATSADLTFWIRDGNGDADALMLETTEFFYKTGKTNVYNPEFRELSDIPELTCTGTTEMSCVYHATFVGGLGWRDVFSGRIQARDAGGRVSKVIPFHVAIGTQN